MTDSGWFMTAEITRRGVIKAWQYPAGARPEDLEFMSRATAELPRLVDSPTERIYREPATTPDLENRWFRK